MDDSLAQPSSELQKPKDDAEDVEEEEESGDEEEGGLDWTKLLPQAARPVIPKRGEKEFEPSAEGGSNLQQFILNRSRNAMFDALRAVRSISQKSLCYGLYHPALCRVSVPITRGQVISTIGHSAPRPIVLPDGTTKIQKRLELLPEEAIYLIERGSMFCWKDSDAVYGASNANNKENHFEIIEGAPMTVQQAFTELIGKEGLTLEKYQASLAALFYGFMLTSSATGILVPQAIRIFSHTDSTPKRALPDRRTIPLIETASITATSSNYHATDTRRLQKRFTWWGPLRFGRWICGAIRYGELFKALRIIPAGHGVPLYTPPKPVNHPTKDSPYKFFYNVYKPPTAFKKSAPGPPDYQIAVVDARTTPMPTLHELTALYDISPEWPVPMPKYRRPPPPSRPGQPPLPERRGPNPFAALRAGKKTVVIAVVDAGNVGFFRFAQGEWGEWPMIG
ncbi:tRNA-splicing endonuclease subunit sen54 [Marasmius sp. AFHP31]|nr:tRNA-splicing endonuclease subunit sen54 [Marasmius sp. AFHP31]